ncbi:hypothetical protein Tco_0717228, partial [Tanacetum coccineum]
HIHLVVFTYTSVETDMLKVTPVAQIYQCLADGATMGTKFIVYGMVIGFDLDKDWKFIQLAPHVVFRCVVIFLGVLHSLKAIAESEIDEIPDEVKEVAVDQHVELMQNEGSE